MKEQIVAQVRPSKFAGALYQVPSKGNIFTAFVLQLVIVTIAIAFVRPLSRDSLRPFPDYFFSLDDILQLAYILLVSWTLVWIVCQISKKFPAWLLPHGFVHRLKHEDDARTIIQEAFDKEISYSDAQSRISNKLNAITVLDQRISRLRGRTNLMLYAAGCLLLGASLIVVFAGTLTNLDASAVSNVDKISKEINDVERRLGRLSQVEELKKPSQNDPTAAKKLSTLLDSDATLPTSEDSIKSAKAAEEAHLKQSTELLKQAWEKELTSERGYNDTRYIIATAITRIGVVLVIIFLAQILIGLYRYNTKLITFYHSRRDLLQIWDGKGANIEKLQKLTAPNIDFGKEPKHPLEDVIRQVLAKVHLTSVPIGETGRNLSKKG